MTEPRQLNVSARIENLRKIVSFVITAARDAGADLSAQHDIRLAVDEVCTNIIEHGYRGVAGPIAIEVSVVDNALHIRIADEAPRFDPRTLSTPDLGCPQGERALGKLGWHLTRSVMDEVHHASEGERGNVVTLVKTLTRKH